MKSYFGGNWSFNLFCLQVTYKRDLAAAESIIKGESPSPYIISCMFCVWYIIYTHKRSMQTCRQEILLQVKCSMWECTVSFCCCQIWREWTKLAPHCRQRETFFVALFSLVGTGRLKKSEYYGEQVRTRETITIRDMGINTALYFTPPAPGPTITCLMVT